MEPALKINEIFYSLQGESLLSGKPTTFVRTATCNMRCRWCDTRYAFWEGRRMTLSQIIEKVSRNPTRYVCLSGGEPMGQRASVSLMKRLIDEGYSVSLETGGGFSVREVPREVIKVIDIKCPDSGETDAMCWDNLNLVDKKDQFKFVIASERDFVWACELVEREALSEKCTVLFSAAEGWLKKEALAGWVLEKAPPVTFQTQLHKELWGASRGV